MRIGENSSTTFPDRKLQRMEYSLIGDEPSRPDRLCVLDAETVQVGGTPLACLIR